MKEIKIVKEEHLIAIIQVILVTLIELGCIIADIVSSIINKKNGKNHDHELLICCILPTVMQILVIVYFISEAIKGNL